MMKKRILLWMGVLLLLLFLAGCKGGPSSFGSTDIMDTIAEPQIKRIEISGTWTLDHIEKLSEKSTERTDFVIGQSAYIDQNLVAIGDRVTMNPKFTSKYVNFDEYMQKRFLASPTQFTYDQENIEIYSIRDGQNFSQEFLFPTENLLIYINDQIVYYLTRESDTVDEGVLSWYQKNYRKEKEQDSTVAERKESTFLLGVRYKSKTLKNMESTYKYETYFVHNSVEKKPRVYLSKDLLIPRESGFWKLKVTPQGDRENGYQNLISAENLNVDSGKENSNQFIDPLSRMITYVHDGYVAFRKTNYYSQNPLNSYKYEILALDKLAAKNPLTIQEIAGEAGLQAYRAQIASELEYFETNYLNRGETIFSPDLTNVGILRDTNAWKLVSNIEVQYGTNIHKANMNLNIVPNGNIMKKDELAIPWQTVKTKNSECLSAFTSPNKDLLIMVTENEILLYDLFGNNIATTPKASIQTQPGTTVVMMEFAPDNMAKTWEDVFVEQGIDTPPVL